jgi:hypothetical protein
LLELHKDYLPQTTRYNSQLELASGHIEGPDGFHGEEQNQISACFIAPGCGSRWLPRLLDISLAAATINLGFPSKHQHSRLHIYFSGPVAWHSFPPTASLFHAIVCWSNKRTVWYGLWNQLYPSAFHP